jgi:hypothetical protein
VSWAGSSTARAPKEEPAVIELPGGAAGIGFDDLRFSPVLKALLVPGGRTGSLFLVDPATRKVRSVSGFRATEKFGGGHGEGTTSADEGLDLVFASDRDSRELAIVDPGSRRIISRAKLSGSPDYVRFVAAVREVWVTEPDAERIEIFRLETERAPHAVTAGRIDVKGGPESLVIDGEHGRAYTHLWEGRTVAIDLKTHSIVGNWLNGCRGSRGIALDPGRRLLFVGCAEGKAVVLSSVDGHRLASALSGDGVDVIAYSARLARLYVPGAKSATMAIFGVSPKGDLTLLRTVRTAPGAHCVAVDDSDQAYVCDPKKGRLLVVRDSRD